MRRPRKLSRKNSRKMFKKGALKTHRKNGMGGVVQRGGVAL